MSKKVTVIATIAMQRVLEQLEPELVRATGCGIAMTFGPPVKAVQLVRDGEPADIVMTTPAGLDELAALGKVPAAAGQVVVKMIMGLAVRAGARKPDVSTVENFKRAVLDAKSVTYANPAGGSPSAAHFLKVAAQLGIADEVKAKSLVSSGLIARHVAAGEAELAVQQLSELLMVEGVDIVGQFPAELQNVVPLAAAVLKDSTVPEAAQALIALIASPRSRTIIEQAGLLPAG